MYAKVFGQIFDSSIASDYLVRHVFMDLLVLADSDGVVDMTIDAIVRRTNTPQDIVVRAISVLSSPDPESRSQEEEGRRLKLIDSHRDWGWLIVNYAHYRDIRDEEGRRRYFRDYQRERRRKKSHLSTPVKDKSHLLKKITHAEAEVQAEAVQRDPQTPELALSPSPPSAGGSEHRAFIEGWTQAFEAFFGFKYAFSGRDAKAAQGLLKLGITRLDLLDIAKSAWQRSQKDRFAAHSKRAATIHGFLYSLNQIRTELKNGHHGSPASKPNPRNDGITIGPTNYATAKPRLQREIEAQRAAEAAMAGQVAAAQNHPSPD